jgi:uncharacterized protein (DUF1330 family)
MGLRRNRHDNPDGGIMTAYALGRFRGPQALHPEVFEYLEKIQTTLDPFSGRFIAHGGRVDVGRRRGPAIWL